MNLGVDVLTRAELRGAIKGLQMAWEHGFRRVMLQVNSLVVTQLIQGIEHPVHQKAMEVLNIQKLIRQDWEVKIWHRYREANQAVDFLGCIGFHFPIGCHTIPTSNTSLGCDHSIKMNMCESSLVPNIACVRSLVG
ncbi:Putative ribonuclease H protein At1g65750 [Linum perenne]